MLANSADCHPAKENLYRNVCIIGAPLSHGQILEGVDKAPDTLRKCGLVQLVQELGWGVNDIGNLHFRHKLSCSEAPRVKSSLLNNPVLRQITSNEYTEDEVHRCRLLGEACGQIADAVSAAAKRGEFVLSIGGDHGIAAGTIAGMLSIKPDLVVLWIDAHGDINTPETSPSKSYHGMPVAHLLGRFKKQAIGFEWMNHIPILKESDLAYIGLRSLDTDEKRVISNSKIAAFSMKDVDRHGIAEILKTALHKIDPTYKRPIHLSFDIDGCDPSIAPGTGTRARGGLNYREAHYICETLYDTGRLVSMDLVEINPELDLSDEYLHGDDPIISKDATKTVRLGLELISSALGKTIL